MATRPRTRYAPGVERRQKLITATVELMCECGIEGVTHRSVAARAGMPLSNTSYFFGSRDELISAAVTEIADRTVARLDRLADSFAESAMTVAEYSDQLIALAASADRAQVVVQFEAYLATERRPHLREPVQRIMLSFERAVADALSAGGVHEPQLVARQIIAIVDGFSLHKAAWPRPGIDDALVSVLRQLLAIHLPSTATGI